MKIFWWLLWPTLFVGSASSNQKIRIDPDGGYTGIVVKINKKVPENECPTILTNVKKLLKDSSNLLYTALNKKAFLKAVTIVVPSTWRDSKCQRIIHSPREDTPYRNADILISEKHPIHGHEIHTEQSGGCGQPGDVIRLPYNFVEKSQKSNNSIISQSKAKLFVENWMKFRYGIFEEYGFVQDTMYPNFFYSKGNMLPTGTSNIQLGGVWINSKSGDKGCDPNRHRNCHFYPNEKQLNHVTCSLSGFHFLPNVTRFCAAQEIAIASPTKHNILCQGKPALEIINSHPDFAKRKQIKAANIDPIFEIVRQPDQQYVLVIETSTKMDAHGRWKWINKAAQKFIRYDLPVNSNLAIVTFSNDSKVEHSMVQVHSDQVRARLADTIPDKYHLSISSNKPCVLCALQKVIQEVLTENKSGTQIILVSQEISEYKISQSDKKLLKELVKINNIQVHTIAVTNKSILSKSNFFNELTNEVGGGNTYNIQNSGSMMEFFVLLNEAYSDILKTDAKNPTEIPELVYQEAFSGKTGVTSGNFLIDSTLGRDTQFGIYVEDEEDHLIKSVRFTDSKGRNYGPFLRMSSDFDLVNFKTINFPDGQQSPPFNAPNQIGMTWQYSIEWHSTHSNRNESIVVVTSKPRSQSEKDLIRVKAWTSSQKHSENAENHSETAKIVLFVQVLRGDSPIIGAKVVAAIKLESIKNNGTTVEYLPSVNLEDNGYGDPDIVYGDGIYSRYLGRYLKAGRYSFTIKVDDNDNNAFYVFDEDTSNESPEDFIGDTENNLADTYYKFSSQRKCCGSSVLPSLELDKYPIRKVQPGIFRREILGPVIYIDNPLKPSDDSVPPSKIGDLKIRQMPGASTPDRLLAEWTAPGGDFDAGSVASYKFLFTSNIEDLIDLTKSQPEVLLGFDRLERAGTAAKFEFSFPHYNRDFYVGAIGFDIAGNQGKMSNLVHVRIASPLLVQAKDAKPISSKPNKEDSERDWIVIGSICGIISVLLILAVFSIMYYIVMARKRNATVKVGSTSSVMGGTGLDETDSSSFDSDIKNIMSNPVGAKHQNSSIYQGTDVTDSTNVTPVYWSASQLLSKIDQKNYNYSQPQSLQLESSQNNYSLTQQQPVSLHYNPDYNPSWNYQYGGNNFTQDEYTITVAADGEGTYDVSQCLPSLPNLPKPRNITQV